MEKPIVLLCLSIQTFSQMYLGYVSEAKPRMSWWEIVQSEDGRCGGSRHSPLLKILKSFLEAKILALW